MFYQFPVFGSAISQCFTKEFVGTEILTPSEKTVIEKVAEKRARDFSTGRLCARKALEDLGLNNIEILQGANREPIWPQDIVGSISHSEKLAGAIVSRSSDIRSVGLDIETIGGVKPDLWNNLFSGTEQDFLNTFNIKEQELYSTLLFSLKESFYKMQYPVTGMFLEFSDVEIHHHNGNFRFKSNQALIDKIPLESIVTQWLEFEGHVITFCRLTKYHEGH